VNAVFDHRRLSHEQMPVQLLASGRSVRTSHTLAVQVRRAESLELPNVYDVVVNLSNRSRTWSGLAAK